MCNDCRHVITIAVKDIKKNCFGPHIRMPSFLTKVVPVTWYKLIKKIIGASLSLNCSTPQTIFTKEIAYKTLIKFN